MPHTSQVLSQALHTNDERCHWHAAQWEDGTIPWELKTERGHRVDAHFAFRTSVSYIMMYALQRMIVNVQKTTFNTAMIATLRQKKCPLA